MVTGPLSAIAPPPGGRRPGYDPSPRDGDHRAGRGARRSAARDRGWRGGGCGPPRATRSDQGPDPGGAPRGRAPGVRRARVRPGVGRGDREDGRRVGRLGLRALREQGGAVHRAGRGPDLGGGRPEVHDRVGRPGGDLRRARPPRLRRRRLARGGPARRRGLALRRAAPRVRRPSRRARGAPGPVRHRRALPRLGEPRPGRARRRPGRRVRRRRGGALPRAHPAAARPRRRTPCGPTSSAGRCA